jgi:serine/threonine protein kinase
MKGTLEALVESGADTSVIANSVCPQMLQALDHTTWKGIIHRDMKSENILYETHPGGQYQFRLTDFGLSNRTIDAIIFASSRLYMAPEIFRETDQSSKVDVWSLFVTMLWILDIEFRKREFHSEKEVWEVVLSVASRGDISKNQEMAIVDLARRASAAQMLVKCYNGEGLSTPRNQVPALTSRRPKIAAARAPPPASPSTTRTGQTKPRGLRTNANIFAAATQYRVEKARSSSTTTLPPATRDPPKTTG